MQIADPQDHVLDLEVVEAVKESLSLGRRRGAAFETLTPARAGQARTYRRQTGLDWLASKGRLTPAQHTAGLRYGAIYRKVRGEVALRSSLNLEPGQGGGRPLSAVIGQAEARMRASEALVSFRRILGQQASLVAACDLICGEELTPREATETDREAGRMEAVLAVALDLISVNPSSGAPGTPHR
jgi:hypothetical protein